MSIVSGPTELDRESFLGSTPLKFTINKNKSPSQVFLEVTARNFGESVNIPSKALSQTVIPVSASPLLLSRPFDDVVICVDCASAFPGGIVAWDIVEFRVVQCDRGRSISNHSNIWTSRYCAYRLSISYTKIPCRGTRSEMTSISTPKSDEDNIFFVSSTFFPAFRRPNQDPTLTLPRIHVPSPPL